MPTGTAAREASRFRRTHLYGQLEGRRSSSTSGHRGDVGTPLRHPHGTLSGFSLAAEHRTTLDWNAGVLTALFLYEFLIALLMPLGWRTVWAGRPQ
jgi:hypothetical protein